MNALGRLLFGAPPDAPKPRAPWLGCPQCGCIAFAVAASFTSYRLEDGRIVAEPNGGKLSCPRCGTIFAIDPLGAFYPHAQSLPPTPTLAPREGGTAATNGPPAATGRPMPPRARPTALVPPPP